MAKKSKELYLVMSSVNDIYILRKNVGQRSPHPDYFLAIKITFTYIYISVWIRKNVATEFDLSLIIVIQFCLSASFPQGLS